MAYINTQTNFFENPKPEQVTLSDGTVLTGDQITHEILLANGWVWVETPPIPPCYR